MKTLLIAEDENAIREFITINLRSSGYEVFEAKNGVEAISIFNENKNIIDVALLDIMMDGFNGIEVCKYIREKSINTGIIFLTAKTQESDKVAGFSGGADDYITKPFSLAELLVRIEAVYRRVEYSKNLMNSVTKNQIILGEYCLDLKRHCLLKNDKKIELTQIEFQLINCFFNNPNESISRHSLLEEVWGDCEYVDDKIVDVNIRRLRMKIENDPSTPKHLVTVWGQGYRWTK